MAIGVEDGFQIDKNIKYEDHYALVLLPDFETIQINNLSIPAKIYNSIQSIIKAEPALKLTESELKNFEWNGEQRQKTKHTNLFQISNPPKPSLNNSQCQKCDVKENLWFNLSDGSIMCGRKNFDGTGGNNHAVEHYISTHYPLAVKIGTITESGADVYSYDEDDMVEDPMLESHLAHFDINMNELLKTEKTLSELEIEMNENYFEWNAIQELSGNLKPIYGPGFTGIYNLGNTCYISSIMQMIFALPLFKSYFYDNYKHFMLGSLSDTLHNFDAQTAKLAYGLLSGKYSKKPIAIPFPPNLDSENYPNSSMIFYQSTSLLGIKPRAFNFIVKRGHTEFANSRQQDAHEFFLHLMNQISRHHYADKQLKGVLESPSKGFDFMLEEKWWASDNHDSARLIDRRENYISLAIPPTTICQQKVRIEYNNEHELDLRKEGDPGNLLDIGGSKHPHKTLTKIPFSSLLEHYFAAEQVNTKDGEVRPIKTVGFKTFPQYLLLHLKKYTFERDGNSCWQPKKLEVSIENIPEILDLERYKATGLLPMEILNHEKEIDNNKEEENILFSDMVTQNNLVGDDYHAHLDYNVITHQSCSNPEALILKNEISKELLAMGFSVIAINAAIASQTESPAITIEAVLNSLLTSQSKSSPEYFQTSRSTLEHVNVITDMGFSVERANTALDQTENDPERALDWLFSHPEETGIQSVTVKDKILNNSGRHVFHDHIRVQIDQSVNSLQSDQSEQSAEHITNHIHHLDPAESTIYRLVGFVSHVGSSLNCGHYVCHIKKDGDWVIFNDSKVALSNNPPLNLAYMYFYERVLL
ncbi:ubiquitin carboxyl-terminal hydrolase 5-like isoform X1 [Gordionus sp. m RMFG-2023]|uniref:ubiquitin carboxyl-terminal hydrolase 5-like isoform X1 n=1 Tax=Gordionus sp. m RMFG-2023 TaxID=3053472 RepID=UPI0031FCCA78